MASVPQEDYIRQLLDESFRTESDSENIANDTQMKMRRTTLKLFKKIPLQNKKGRMMNKMLIMSSHSSKLNPY